MSYRLARTTLIGAALLLAFLLRPLASLGKGWETIPVSLAFGLVVAGITIAAERALRAAPSATTVGAAGGILVGAVIAAALPLLVPERVRGVPGDALRPFLTLMILYTAASAGARLAEDPRFVRYANRPLPPSSSENKIVDTSVLIDGRIADVCETGFVEGSLVVPRFVLHELHAVADSSDPARRSRGRIGLATLQRLEKSSRVTVRISDEEIAEPREVDLKLVELARRTGGKLLTNDFNLNKVASIVGVTVLNLNDLALALRPVALPGETFRVSIVREGKEPHQGVAYLDDGTMIVVEQARGLIGRSVDVAVTSVLQTTSGKMFFARVAERGAASDQIG